MWFITMGSLTMESPFAVNRGLVMEAGAGDPRGQARRGVSTAPGVTPGAAAELVVPAAR